MNAPHPANSVFRAIKSATEKPAPEFTHKLSYDEQRKLTDAQWGRYMDWLFSLNAPASKRWERRERGEDTAGADATADKHAAHARGWGWME